MRTSDLEIIHADIMIASSAYYENCSGKDYKPYMISMSAYHSGQAIEKCLKAILKEKAHDVYKEYKKSHEFAPLILGVANVVKGFLEVHKFIAINGSSLSMLNCLRYGKMGIDTKSALEVLKAAKSFYKELEKEVYKIHPDKIKNRQYTVHEYQKLPSISFKPLDSHEEKGGLDNDER